MKKTFLNLLSLVAMLATATLTLTSCLGNENEGTDGDNCTFYDYFTITGNLQGYVLYGDHGNKVTPDMTSVTSLCGEKGFGTHRRGLLQFSCTTDQITEEGTIVNGAKLTGGSYMIEALPMSLDEAQAAQVNATDSIYSVMSIEEPWIYRGFFNILVTGYYTSKAAPTLSMVYDPASITENAITIDLYYNVHNTSVAGYSTFAYTFSIDQFASIIPGDGDVTVTLNLKGVSEKKLTVKRKDLRF